MSLVRTPSKLKANHYKLFDFEDKNKNNFGCNASRRFIEESQKLKDTDFNMIDANDRGKLICLIEGEIDLIVYADGVGNHICEGQYVQYKKKVYYEDQTNHIERQIATSIYGKGENPLPIQLVFSMAKSRFKAKIQLGPQMSEKIIVFEKQKKNKRIIIELQILNISDYPINNGLGDLESFHATVIKNSLEGDIAFENNDLQKSLYNYQCAIQKIYSEYYVNALIFNKQAMIKQEKQEIKKTKVRKEKQSQRLMISDKYSKTKYMIDQIQLESEKIVLKGIQVALIASEFLKVIRWIHSFMLNPKNNNNVRALLCRSEAYIALEEYSLALIDLRQIRSEDVLNEKTKHKIRQVEDMKKKYDEEREIEYQNAIKLAANNRIETKIVRNSQKEIPKSEPIQKNKIAKSSRTG